MLKCVQRLMYLAHWSLNSVKERKETRTIPTERPPLVSEVSANFFADRGLPCGHREESLKPYSRISRPEPLLFLPSSSSVVLTRMSGPSSRPTNIFIFFLVVPGNRTRDFGICSQELWSLDHRDGRSLCKCYLNIQSTSHLILFTEIIADYLENHVKFVNTLCDWDVEFPNVEVCGTCSYHWHLKKVILLFRQPLHSIFLNCNTQDKLNYNKSYACYKGRVHISSMPPTVLKILFYKFDLLFSSLKASANSIQPLSFLCC
jgi:hypothetical protein